MSRHSHYRWCFLMVGVTAHALICCCNPIAVCRQLAMKVVDDDGDGGDDDGDDGGCSGVGADGDGDGGDRRMPQ